jgi:signal transduction histidine kinase
MRILNKMDSRTDSPISLEIKTTIHIGRRPMYLQFSFVPTYDSEGHVVSYFGMCRDMSEIKATEQQLEEQTARAQEVENLKNSFLRNMSYEIRTPLNAVVGFAELLEMEDNSLEDEEVFIQQIKDNSAHLLQLINDILFLSRLDANMIEITPQPTDFAVSFDAHCQVGWMGHEKPGVRYIVENRYSQLVVEIDDTNVGRVIEQIVSNAVSHTSEGYVRTRYDYVGDKLIIAIEDSGKGIPPELLNQIYERFAGNGQGTRLGLPICKELVEQMGGTIDIDSTQGDGTTVWISIPCKASLIVRKKDI